jgi:HEAT repeat protein
MTCQHARDHFPDLLDPRTAATAHLEVRRHLASCPACQTEFARISHTAHALDALPVAPPSPRLRQNFYALLAAEKGIAPPSAVAPANSARPGGFLRWFFAPVAAMALALLSFVAGTRYATAPAPTPVSRARAIAAEADATTAHRKIAELERKLDTMGQLVGYTILQQQRPTHERLRSVLRSASSASENPDDSVINELISALAFDPSINVRLRAIEALFPHADQDVVRAGVLASLSREQNPLVQVSMIDFLTEAGDTEARPALEKISLSESTDRSVRDAARRALAQF